MTKINSKTKGASGEREIASLLRDYGFESARRMAQFCGNTGEAQDISCTELDELSIEVKRLEKINVEKCLNQAIRDTETNGKLPVVFHRKNRSFWICSMRLGDFLTLYSELLWLRKKFKELS